MQNRGEAASCIANPVHHSREASCLCPWPISVSKIVCKTGACQQACMSTRWRLGLHIPSLSRRLRCCKLTANLL